MTFQTELVLEAARKVLDTAAAITAHVWSTTDVVEHVTTAEQQDGEDGNGGPEIPVLEDRQEVRVQHGDADNRSDSNCTISSNLDPVHGARQGWPRNIVGKFRGYPGVDGFSGRSTFGISMYRVYVTVNTVGLPSHAKVIADRLAIRLCVRTSSGQVEQEHWRCLELHLICFCQFSSQWLQTRWLVPIGMSVDHPESPASRRLISTRRSGRLESSSLQGGPIPVRTLGTVDIPRAGQEP